MDNYEAIYEFSKPSKKIFNIINLTYLVLYMHSTPLYLFHLLIPIKVCIVFMEDGLLKACKGGAHKDL